MLDDLGMNTDGKKIWKESKVEFNSTLPIVYMAKEKAGLDDAGYIV